MFFLSRNQTAGAARLDHAPHHNHHQEAAAAAEPSRTLQSGPGHVSERRVHSTRLHLRRREGLLRRERRVQMRWVDRASDVSLGLGRRTQIVTSPSFFTPAVQVRRRRVNPTSSSARTAAVHSSCGAATETTTARTTPTRPTAVSFPSVSVVHFPSFFLSPWGGKRSSVLELYDLAFSHIWMKRSSLL